MWRNADRVPLSSQKKKIYIYISYKTSNKNIKFNETRSLAKQNSRQDKIKNKMDKLQEGKFYAHKQLLML